MIMTMVFAASGTLGQYLDAFAHDDKLKLVIGLIALDFIFGVADALKAGAFRLSLVADTLRKDVLGKVFPWFVLYAADKASHAAGIVGPIDISTFETGAWVAVTAALGASILNSIRGLSNADLPEAIAGDEPV